MSESKGKSWFVIDFVGVEAGECWVGSSSEGEWKEWLRKKEKKLCFSFFFFFLFAFSCKNRGGERRKTEMPVAVFKNGVSGHKNRTC